MTVAETLTLRSSAQRFSDDEAAWHFRERFKWLNGAVCPHCGTIDNTCYLAPTAGTRKTSTGRATYRRLWKCAACREQFSVLIGPLIESTRLPISKWLVAIHLIIAGKNRVTPLELARTVGIGYRAVWFMAHPIRFAMAALAEAPQEQLSGKVEADEAYVGRRAHGKRGQRNASDKSSSRGVTTASD